VVDNRSAGFEALSQAVADFQRSDSFARLQPLVVSLLGPQTFGLGVIYGMGENVVGGVLGLAQLAKTFLLADLYDRTHQPAFMAVVGPLGLFQRLLAELSMRGFRQQLEEAHAERDALIAELRDAVTHPLEVLGSIGAAYVEKWKRFEELSTQHTLSARFHAGRILGEVLLDVFTLIGGGAAAVKAASKIPRLAKLARLQVPAKSAPSTGRTAEAAAVREMPGTPSQVRSAPVADAVPKKPELPGEDSVLAGSIRNVNPLRSATNCVNCAVATDATLAGHPASALASGPTSIRVLEATYGGQFVRVSSQSAIEAQLLSAGPGARGISFGSRGPGQVGHVFNGINQGGVVRFLDGQTGTVASFQGFTELYFLPTGP